MTSLQCFDAVGWVPGGRKSIQPIKTSGVTRLWHSYLSGARCKWFAYGPADATATPIISCSNKIQNGLPFRCRYTLQPDWLFRPVFTCLFATSRVPAYHLDLGDWCRCTVGKHQNPLSLEEGQRSCSPATYHRHGNAPLGAHHWRRKVSG